ncbi:hypothetical protein HMSSN036_52190 [Paenibacillus macerans]|nr:hypothetical protein HMSSN036_52190 [Paenibacillus macerans]
MGRRALYDEDIQSGAKARIARDHEEKNGPVYHEILGEVVMQQVTFNIVRYAVHDALDAAFPDIRIMGEEIKQGLNPPCFLRAY